MMHRFEKYHFKGHTVDEKILFVVHRHWFDIAQQFFIIFLLLCALAGSFFILPWLFQAPLTGAHATLFLFIQSTFLLMLWVYGFLIWVDYYLDVWIITDKRLVNIEQRGLFFRHVSELKFGKVQDVTSEVEGIFPTLLNYGDVHVQSAGQEPRFTFHHVPDPYHIKAVVMTLHKDARERGVGALDRIPEQI